MDNEAKRRTCSAYLVDRVIPMLPERLCNDVCSLRPGEDRLAMSVVMTLDARGKVVRARMCRSAICSAARLSYDEVDALLEGAIGPDGLPCAPEKAPGVADLLHILDEIRALREHVRHERGAIDFETVETKVRLDETGRPTGVMVRRRTRATGLIEEAMLLANECVARRLAQAEAPPPTACMSALPRRTCAPASSLCESLASWTGGCVGPARGRPLCHPGDP